MSALQVPLSDGPPVASPQYVLGLRAMDCRNGKVIAQDQVQTARKEVYWCSGSHCQYQEHELENRSAHPQSTTNRSSVYDAFYGSPEGLYPGTEEAYGGDTAAACSSSCARWNLIRTSLRPIRSFRLHSIRQSRSGCRGYPQGYELRDKVPSEHERRVIEANYYVLATGELEKAEHTLNVLKETFPAHPNLTPIWEELTEDLETHKKQWKKPARRCDSSQPIR